MRNNNLIYYIAFPLFILISLFFNRAYHNLINYTELTNRANRVHSSFQHIRILINNAAEQHPQKDIQDITQKQLEKTFQTNIYAMFFLVKAALS